MKPVKFLAVHFGHLRNLVPDEDYRALCRRHTFTVRLLNGVFASLSRSALFYRTGIGPIFGEASTTVFTDGDEAIAYELFAAAGQAFRVQTSGNDDLDILNEAFGHHVRDSFRNHIEDAQYMTPLEVVDFMVRMAMHLIENRNCGLA